MAIGSIEYEDVVSAPKSIKAPGTWGDLQAMNSIVPGTFYKERVAVLSDPEKGSAFATLDSALAQAGWSRRDTDDPQEALPPHLQKAAAEMLELLGILERSTGVEGVKSTLASVISRVRTIGASIRDGIMSLAGKSL